MLAAGWHAHTLNAPGKFLISAPEHDTPKRARAYLLTDQAVADTARWYADLRPPLDPVSAAALGTSTGEGPADPDDGPDEPDPAGWRGGGRRADPDALLWDALSIAPEQGVPVANLVAAFGQSAEPVVDPPMAPARRGHQIGHRDALLRRDGQRVPQQGVRVGAAPAAAPARRIGPVRAIIGICGPLSGGCAERGGRDRVQRRPQVGVPARRYRRRPGR